jgi:DNA polymerase-3 subunit beta
MKITCDRIDLLNSLEKVIHAVPNRSTLPILQGIKITTEEDKIILFATDLHIGILDTIEAKIDEEGETVIPAKLFYEIGKKATGTLLIINVNDDNVIEITDGKAQFTITGMEAIEFPEFEEVKIDKIFTLSQQELKDAIRKTIFATAKEELRPVLTGVYFEFLEDKTVAVGLDGYRMAVWKKSIQNSSKASVIIPAKTLNEIYKILENSEEEVQIGISKVLNYVLFIIGTTKIKSSLINGNYIDYEAVLPKKYNTKIRINKETFKNGIERAALVTEEKNKMIKFEIDDDYLIISSTSEHGKMEERIKVEVEGNGLKIAFNTKYLLECLNIIDAQELELNFIDSVNPLIIKPIDTDYLYMALPVKLS